jgi:acetyl esterase/lipase
MRGVPILSIDYSLSPENRYPVALQEILDVYLFLSGIDGTSVTGNKNKETESERRQRKEKEIVSMIGFAPKNIVLCGDSAGSNLSVALMHVLKSLNELLLNNCNNNDDHRLSSDGLQIPYPRSVCLQYPYMTPTITRFTPSRLFMAFDPILPLGAMFALSEAYHPQSKTHHRRDDASRPGGKQSHPWYRQPDWSQRLRQIRDTDLGAFFNPLCGTFDDFRDIPLFIQVGEFDPLLDEAISLAKKWKG